MNYAKLLKEREKYIRWANSATKPEQKARYEKLVDEFETRALNAVMYKIEAFGVDGQEWLTWAKSLYAIANTEINDCFVFVVHSNAANWKEEMSWIFDTEAESLNKILGLIGYKIQDRNRGRGDVAEDLTVN